MSDLDTEGCRKILEQNRMFMKVKNKLYCKSCGKTETLIKCDDTINYYCDFDCFYNYEKKF